MRRAVWAMRTRGPAARLTVVAVVVAGLIVAQFVLVIGGGIAADRSAQRALTDSFSYIADVSEDRVVTFVRSAQETVIEAAPRFGDEVPPVLSVLRDFYDRLESHPEVASLSVTYTNGDYVSLARSRMHAGGYSAHVIVVRASGTVSHRFAEYDSQLRLISEHHNVVDIDPRDADSYRVALGNMGVVWTQPAVDPMTSLPQVAVVQSARDESGLVHAVVTASIYLDKLSDSLNALPAGSDGEVFLLAYDRTLITVPASREAVFDDYLRQNGTMPDLSALGLATSHEGAPLSADAEGTDGTAMTFERGLGSDGVAWVIHLRATEVGLNEGFAAVHMTMRWLVGGLTVLTAGIAYLLAILWRPLRKMRDGAERDPLTGLFNRRHAAETLQRMLALAHRTQRRLAIIMFDVDNFKALNDHLGHDAGDQALAEISATLTSQMRASDIAVRWGGDEFLAALVVPEEEDTAAVVERVRFRVEHALIDGFGAERELGITAGFCASRSARDNVSALIGCADRALVTGKARGKGATYEGSPERTAEPVQTVGSGR